MQIFGAAAFAPGGQPVPCTGFRVGAWRRKALVPSYFADPVPLGIEGNVALAERQ
ncbi:hypothetical protein GCM10017711_39720 [Paeniglutamicibacter sulfureus]